MVSARCFALPPRCFSAVSPLFPNSCTLSERPRIHTRFDIVSIYSVEYIDRYYVTCMRKRTGEGGVSSRQIAEPRVGQALQPGALAAHISTLKPAGADDRA